MSTVFGVTKRAAAISLFERPSAASAAMRRSVSVSSPVGGGAPADARELGAGLVRPEPSAELLEDRECLLERLARRALHPGASAGRAEREQRPGLLEGHRHALVLDERVLEQHERPSRSPRAAARRPRQRPAAASAEARSTAAAWRSRVSSSDSASSRRPSPISASMWSGTKRTEPGSRTPPSSSRSPSRAEQVVHGLEALERELQQAERARADDGREHDAMLRGERERGLRIGSRALDVPSGGPY